MHRRPVSLEELRALSSQQTHELQATERNLAAWLGGTHRSSEGEYLEHLVRSQLRRRLPRMFEISTGFISAIDQSSDGPSRLVSRQHDILIWDAVNHPPLFRAGDLVVVIPESVMAVIEVTATLTAKKLHEDLEKLDDLWELYGPERQGFIPYTGIIAFDATQRLDKVLQNLERWYLHQGNLPGPFRYDVARSRGGLRDRIVPAFVNAICVVNKGLISGRSMLTSVGPVRRVVRYTTWPHTDTLHDSFGRFERDLVLTLSEIAGKQGPAREASVDVYREFSAAGHRPGEHTLIIEDAVQLVPSLNVLERMSPARVTNNANGLANVSAFVGVDYMRESGPADLYLTHFGGNGWAFERHQGDVFASGKYRNGVRVGSWRLWTFTENGHRSRTFWIANDGRWRGTRVDGNAMVGEPGGDLAQFIAALLGG